MIFLIIGKKKKTFTYTYINKQHNSEQHTSFHLNVTIKVEERKARKQAGDGHVGVCAGGRQRENTG